MIDRVKLTQLVLAGKIQVILMPVHRGSQFIKLTPPWPHKITSRYFGWADGDDNEAAVIERAQQVLAELLNKFNEDEDVITVQLNDCVLAQVLPRD